jgi:predicted RND superfamily exporter protein
LHEAVVRAGRTRLKPILMTSLATVLGLLPMAIGLGGESTQAPLAITVIGGLTFSTVLTLFFVPILYTIFEEWFKRDIQINDDAQYENGHLLNNAGSSRDQSSSESTRGRRRS